MNANSFLKDLSSEQRVADLYHHIDPGFINHRLCLSTFGQTFSNAFEKMRRRESDFMSELYNNRLLVTMAVDYCRLNEIPTLSILLHDRRMGLFCSTENLESIPEVYEKDRVSGEIDTIINYNFKVLLEFHTRHFGSDTGKLEVFKGHKLSIIGGVREITSTSVKCYPLIIGAPTFDHPRNKEISFDASWIGWEFYEIFPEDIDEFSAIRDLEVENSDEWMDYMKTTPEKVIKGKFAEILGDLVAKDWGGEQYDHFSSSCHLAGRRKSAAFVFKGPASGNYFKVMTPAMLGKNGDQIYRLSQSGADLLILQHCHNIGEAVRETIRAFAVNPSNPRRYCCIDGKDTYKILKSYGKL